LTNNCVYVSPEFASVWRTMGGREVFLTQETDDGFLAGMAGIIFGSRLMPRFQSMPDGLPGGVFSSLECTPEQRDDFFRSFVSWMRSSRMIRADINNPPDIFNMVPFGRQETMSHIIDLKGETYSPPRREVRKQIRAARRREARVTMMNDEKYLKRFYELVIATEKRHDQAPRYTPEFFAELLKVSINDKRIRWFIALVDEKIIGYHICFVAKTELMTWQYYSDKKFTRLKPGYLLLDNIINYALDNNLKTINMGYSPPGADSLVNFKERWGGREQKISYYTYFNPMGKLIYKWRSK